MTSKIRGPLIAGLLALGLIATGCAADAAPAASGDAGGSPGGETVTLTVGMTPAPNAASVYLGIEEGFFAEEGLEIEPKTIQAAAAAIPSLLADELQYGLISAVPSVTAASKGLPIKIAVGNDRYGDDPNATDGFALIANPASGITDLDALEGRTVAVVGLKSAPELALRLAMRDAGVDPDGVNFVEIPYPDMLGALQGDRVDAALTVDPFLAQSKAEGMQVVSQPFIEGMGGMAGIAVVASAQFLESNPDVAGRFARAMRKSVEFAAANPDAVRGILGTFTSMSEEAIAKSNLPHFDPNVGADDIAVVAEAMIAEGFIEDTGWDAAELVWVK